MLGAGEGEPGAAGAQGRGQQVPGRPALAGEVARRWDERDAFQVGRVPELAAPRLASAAAARREAGLMGGAEGAVARG